MNTYTGAEISIIAKLNNMKCKTVIPGVFSETEYLVVDIKPFVSAFFIMDNETFNYNYSHTYNAINDKKYKRLPKAYKKVKHQTN